MQQPSNDKPAPPKHSGLESLDPFTVLKQGWKVTYASLGSFIPALLIAFVVVFWLNYMFTLGLQQYFPQLDEKEVFIRVIQLLSIVIAPIEAACIMMGVAHARGEKTRAFDIFGQFKHSAVVILASLLMMFLTQVGLMLFYLPGIFLLVALSMTMPLVLDQKMRPLEAMKVSVMTTRHHWFKLFTLYSICIILVLVGASLFGIGVLIAVPFFMNVKGLLYLHLFQATAVAASDSGSDKEQQDHDHFEA